MAPSFDQIDAGDESRTKAFTSWKLDLVDAMAADHRLRPMDFRVGVIILQHLNAKTGLCCPSHELVAAFLRVTTRTVELSTANLKRAGWLDWVHTKAGNRYSWNALGVSAWLDWRTSIREGLAEDKVRRGTRKMVRVKEGETRKSLRVETRNFVRVTPERIFALTPNQTPEGEHLESLGIEGRKTDAA